MTKENQVWLNGKPLPPSEYEIKDGVITFKEPLPVGKNTIGIEL